MMTRKSIVPLLLALAIGLTACGLSNEPPAVSTISSPTRAPATVADLGRPAARIDLQRGAALYNGAQGCQTCHGLTGLGDGPVAASFTCPMPVFSDSTAYQERTIADLFTITTNGKGTSMECLMPRWNGRLNEQQRWDVTAYTFALHYNGEMLARGREIWTARCASCHGANGEGSPDAEKPVANLSRPDSLITKTDGALMAALTGDLAGVADHDFSAQIEPADRLAVSAYLRTLAWDGVEILTGQPVAVTPATNEPAATEDATPAAVSPTAVPGTTPTAVAVLPTAPLSIEGRITAGTAGMTLPANLPVTVRVIAQGENNALNDVTALEVTTDADGRFALKDVPRGEGYVYVAVATYADVLQFGAPLPATEAASLALELPLHETTTDASALQIEIARVFIDVVDTERLIVQMALRYRSVGDRIYVTGDKTANGDPITFRLGLPLGAESVTLSADLAGQYAVITGGAPVVQGAVPLTPGSAGLVQFDFRLPYRDQVAINMPNPYALASLRVNVPQERLVIRDPRFILETPIALSGETFDTYALQTAIPAGGTFSITAEFATTGTNVSTLLTTAAITFVVTLAGLFGFTMWQARRKQTPSAPETPVLEGELIEALARLDERFAAGAMQKAAYETERASLKAALASILRQKAPDSTPAAKPPARTAGSSSNTARKPKKRK